MLNKGEIEGMILASPINPALVICAPLFKESFKLMIPKGHELSQKKSISQQDLNGESLLLLDEGHCLREQALEVCKLRSSVTKVNYRATSLEMLKQMVAAGNGITLVPE